MFFLFILATTGAVNSANVDYFEKDVKWEDYPPFQPCDTDPFWLPTKRNFVRAINATNPTSFDARTEWPNSIHPIRNQGRCNSCYAFTTTGVLADRTSILKNDIVTPVLSPQQLVSCDTHGNSGCLKGTALAAWKYIEATGVVTEACYPYTSSNNVTGSCLVPPGTTKCPGTGTVTYQKAYGSYELPNNVEEIQNEIMESGPVVARMEGYEDFVTYDGTSVYYHKAGNLLGCHGVILLGWGTDNGVDYWIGANSWGTTWGDRGYFKIKRGNNECKIESQVTTATAVWS